MSLNWKEINVILDELALTGGQIQKIIQPAYDVLCLSVYNKNSLKTILIALTPGACRLHETFKAVPKTDKPLRFAEFFKSRLKDARIEEAVQLGEDRLVRLSTRRGDERHLVYIRLWSNAANIIVTDESGTILDAMRRNPRKGETGGGHYQPENAPLPDRPGVPKKTYEIRDLPGPGSFNERIDSWYGEHAGSLSLDALREQVRKTLGARIFRLEASIEALLTKIKTAETAETLKQAGDLIMANIGLIASGAQTLAVHNFFTDEPTTISLDPKKTPAQNAQDYYDQYRKAKNGTAELASELEEAQQTLVSLETQCENLLVEENPLVVHKALRLLRSPPVAPDKKVRPGLTFKKSDWLIIVGRDAAENDELLRHHVKGSDLWLHVRDFPGGYVFIKARPGKTVPLDILLDAANLALFYSKGRHAPTADLYYTPVKYLKRVKNAPKGTVIPSQEKNLHIQAEASRIKALENTRIV